VGGVELVVPAAAIFNALPVSFLRLVIVRRPQPRAFEAAAASPSRGERRARQMTRTCGSMRVGRSARSGSNLANLADEIAFSIARCP